jgi:hypothetical protein
VPSPRVSPATVKCTWVCARSLVREDIEAAGCISTGELSSQPILGFAPKTTPFISREPSCRGRVAQADPATSRCPGFRRTRDVAWNKPRMSSRPPARLDFTSSYFPTSRPRRLARLLHRILRDLTSFSAIRALHQYFSPSTSDLVELACDTRAIILLTSSSHPQ